MSLSSTPFDDVYKTLCVTCPQLILPLLNETFGTSYSGNEQILQEVTEHRFTEADGTQHKRIADNIFCIKQNEKSQRYILECESNPDGSILVRFFEYAILSGLSHHTVSNYTLMVPLPRIGVLFLRSPKSSPSAMTVLLQLPDGTESKMKIPILKLHNFTVADLFQKKLYILLPFSLFLYEDNFGIIEKNEQMLHDFSFSTAETIQQIMTISSTELNDYQKSILRTMYMTILQHFGRKHSQILKGVQKAMGGHVIDLPQTRIYQSGIQQGIKQEQENSAREYQRAEVATARAELAESRVAELEAKLKEHHISF